MTSLVARTLAQSSRKPMRYVLQEELLSIVKSEISSGQLLDSSQPLQHLAINKRSSEAIYYSAQEGGQFYKIVFSGLDENGHYKKTIQPDMKYPSINQIHLNKAGNRLLLIGEHDINVMSVPGFTSSEADVISSTTIFSFSLLSSVLENSNTILKACWHPHSDDHIVVLDSMNMLRIIQATSGKIDEILLLEDRSEKVLSFTFGSRRSWERFSIFYVSTFKESYRLWVLCPIVPEGCIVSQEFLDDIIDECESESETTMVMNYLPGIINYAIESAGHEQEIVLKPNAKDRAFFTGKSISIDCETDFSSYIADMTSLNVYKSFPTCFACVENTGTIRLFVVSDNIKPKWNLQSKFASPSSPLKSKLYSPISHTISVIPLDRIVLPRVSRPWLVPHPTSSQIFYCVHDGGCHEVIFPFISHIEKTFSGLEQEQSENDKTTVLPLFKSQKLEYPKGFAILEDLINGTSIFYIESRSKNVLLSSGSVFNFTTDETDSTQQKDSKKYAIDTFQKSLEEVTNELYNRNMDVKSKEATLLLVHNTQCYDVAITLFEQKLLSLSKRYHNQQQAVQMLAKKDSQCKQLQYDIHTKYENALNKAKELHKRLEKCYNILFHEQLSKEEKEFMNDIKQKSKVVDTYSSRIENLKHQIDSYTPYEPTGKTYSPEVIEKVKKYLKKTEEILESTKQHLEEI
ncbi:hypothetical protein C9374_009617 [Naegleria lovaniensis]|uniref:Nuclear pore complex protein Nup88 n=1 Tax=Naegleria lovaniensis TaxID=51637 RepID=A0AA88KX48_NAELO|nr:uncharacterized protein C9374_009617 [Naegleria lovaniensis]KAG2393040.1 hypothetical protein C9374_009617 [Naegleria lovaniensis]